MIGRVELKKKQKLKKKFTHCIKCGDKLPKKRNLKGNWKDILEFGYCETCWIIYKPYPQKKLKYKCPKCKLTGNPFEIFAPPALSGGRFDGPWCLKDQVECVEVK